MVHFIGGWGGGVEGERTKTQCSTPFQASQHQTNDKLKPSVQHYSKLPNIKQMTNENPIVQHHSRIPNIKQRQTKTLVFNTITGPQTSSKRQTKSPVSNTLPI